MLNSAASYHRQARIANVSLTLTTDASLKGWGATTGSRQTQGRWTREEVTLHINILELMAVLLGLQALCSDVFNHHIHIKSDNTTNVAFIEHMGEGCRSLMCNKISTQTWNWAMRHNCWLSASYIHGSVNSEADMLSRVFNDRIEWHLNTSIFTNICSFFHASPEIDLFASRINTQL